jgi:CHAD domain-containing protein
MASESIPAKSNPLTSLAEQVDAEARRGIRSRSVESVHDIRVATRRLLQGLALFHAPKKFRKPVKHLLSLAGDVRDCDIAIKLLTKKWAQAGADVRQRIRARRTAAHRMLVASLKSWIATSAEWRSEAIAVAPESHARALAALPQMAADFLRDGNRAASRKARATQIHKFRIQSKHLRYSMELLEPALGPEGEAWIAQMRDLQTALGKINDCRIVRELAEELGAGRAVESALRKHQRKRGREFRRLWKDQFETGAAKEWVRSLEPPARKPMARSDTASAAAHSRPAKRA